MARGRAENEPGPSSPAGFDDLFRAEFASMVRTAHLIVGDREVAREIAQESFTRLLARWDRVSAYDKPGAWLRLVTCLLYTSDAADE